MEPIAIATISFILKRVLELALNSQAESLGEATIESANKLYKRLTEKLRDDELRAEALGEVENSESEDLQKANLERVSEYLQKADLDRVSEYLQKADLDRVSEYLQKANLDRVSEHLQKVMSEDPEFAEDIQEDTQELLAHLKSENSRQAQEILTKVQEMLEQSNDGVRQEISSLQKEINDISVNISKGDYVGRDPYLFTNINSGSINAANIQGRSGFRGISKSFDLNTYDYSTSIEVKDFLAQIFRTRGAITDLFPIEERLNKLVKLRQPSSIFKYKVEEVFLTIPFLVSSFSLRLSPKKGSETAPIYKDSYQEYFEKLSEIESRVDEEIFKNPESSKEIKQILERTNTEVNLRLAVNNDLFISLLYSVSSTQELVANMVSKIGHLELQEEAEMHLSAISQLGDNLNRLIDKLDAYKIKEEENQENNLEENQQQDYQALIANLVDSLGEEELKKNTSLLKGLTEKSKDKTHLDNQEDKSQNSESIYILSDEAQAAVGIMTEIEERKLLVEKLVQIDSFRKSFTSALVTVYVVVIIALAIWGYIRFGSDFELGRESLSDLKVPFIGVPWPVITWSLIGSFAAMIYRFNRQPIHHFGNAFKWMITRPVQGVVLGSAFYLVLVSGLFLFTGNTSTSGSGTAKAAEEVILVLSFLVGFSDRFADTVFNALIDRYSKEAKDQEGQGKGEEKSESHKGASKE